MCSMNGETLMFIIFIEIFFDYDPQFYLFVQKSVSELQLLYLKDDVTLTYEVTAKHNAKWKMSSNLSEDE
jgi:hypothetical protein